MMDRKTFYVKAMGWEDQDTCLISPFGSSNPDVDRYSLVAEDVRMRQKICSLANGPRPIGMEVCHNLNCNNTHCWNPYHMHWGTHAENKAEQAKLGTKIVLGPRLSLEDAIQVHHLYKVNGMTQAAIARIYGVQRPSIANILSGRRHPKALERAIHERA